MTFKVGDIVDYNPSSLADLHTPVKGAKITMFQQRGNIFNQDMAVIEGVECWVPACDLTRLNCKDKWFIVTWTQNFVLNFYVDSTSPKEAKDIIQKRLAELGVNSSGCWMTNELTDWIGGRYITGFHYPWKGNFWESELF